MTEVGSAPPPLHEDPDWFREAVGFTAAQTGFLPRLVEKDYFCSVLLRHLAAVAPELVFKGGTCLAKVHAGFYRMSEDLDFVIPMPTESLRSERSRRVSGLKAVVSRLTKELTGIHVVRGLEGANESTQYTAVFGYSSLLVAREETIQIEVGLREPLLTPSITGTARTLLLDPISNSPSLPPFPVPCLSLTEAMAEKLRAALSRREVAIRDFYDVDHAVRRLGLRARDPELVGLVRAKLGVPGNDPVDVSPVRLAALRPQLEAQLRPVLRDREFAEFELERALAIVLEVAGALG